MIREQFLCLCGMASSGTSRCFGDCSEAGRQIRSYWLCLMRRMQRCRGAPPTRLPSRAIRVGAHCARDEESEVRIQAANMAFLLPSEAFIRLRPVLVRLLANKAVDS